MNLYEMADAAAERYGLDPAIFRRQIETESGFQEGAVSPVGAIGLGQVMPDTARQPGYGVAPLASELMTDPEENLRFSAEYMRAMLDEFDGDYGLALAAYNAGAGAVKKAGGIPNFEETQDYVTKILGSGSDTSAAQSGGGVGGVGGGVEEALRMLLAEEESDKDRLMMRSLAELTGAFDTRSSGGDPFEGMVTGGVTRRQSSRRPMDRFQGLGSLDRGY